MNIDRRKHLAVLLQTADPDRACEALRAAVGLSLRGDHVTLVLGKPERFDSAPLRRYVETLSALGHSVVAHLSTLSDFDGIEVWT